MSQIQNEWFETGEIEGRLSYYSKFSKKDFTVSVTSIQERWASWTPDEKRKFAGAFGFSGRTQLTDNDQRLLDFLMENGDSQVWRAIAIVVARHRDRNRALNFLLTRVTDETDHLANYYQALGILSAPECVPTLTKSLSAHRRKVDLHTYEQGWGDWSIYSDYLACSATLFRITGREEYRDNLKGMLQHPDETIRQKIRTVATGFEI